MCSKVKFVTCVQFCKWSTVSFHASTLLFSKLYINAISLSVAISNGLFFLFLRWQTRESPSAFQQLRLVTWAEASFVTSLVKWHIFVNPDCNGSDTGKIVRTASGKWHGVGCQPPSDMGHLLTLAKQWYLCTARQRLACHSSRMTAA